MGKKFRVLIADDMSARAADILAASNAVEVDVKGGISAADLAASIKDYDGLLVRSRTKVTSAIIAAGDNLKVVGRAGIGVDNIDIEAASRRGIIVENAPSGNSVTTAEHALCLLLSLARNIPQATASLKAGKWEKKKLSGQELMGKTLGIVGLGNIGRIVADRARGLYMKLVGFDPFIGREAASRLGIELLSFDELVTRADFMTIHTPLTDDTRGLFNAAAFDKMKPTALLVNAARGGIVDETALLAALDAGKIAGAALDVFETEPPPADHPLLAHPKLICTPHLGASTGEAQDKVAIEVAEQMVAFAERGEVRNAINMLPVPADVRERLNPWVDLCARLGSLLAQLSFDETGGFFDSVAVEVIGEPGELERGPAACTSSVLVGLLRRQLDTEVNQVNASIIATERGLDVTESKRHADPDTLSAVAVTVRRGDQTHRVKGTLYHIGDRMEPRLVQFDDFIVQAAAPQGRILVVFNEDRPGVIGAVGCLLGERNINVTSLHVGRAQTEAGAIALWNVDSVIEPEVLAEVRAHSFVQKATVVEL